MRRRWDELVLRYIPPKRIELVIRFAVRRRLVVRRPELLGERVEPSGHSHVVSVECVTAERREVGEVCVAAASHRARLDVVPRRLEDSLACLETRKQCVLKDRYT